MVKSIRLVDHVNEYCCIADENATNDGNIKRCDSIQGIGETVKGFVFETY